jgi:hypothetical protein
MRNAAPLSAREEGVAELQDFVARHPRLFVLSGAGVSTASGIPATATARSVEAIVAGHAAGFLASPGAALLGAWRARLADRRRRGAERRTIASNPMEG